MAEDYGILHLMTFITILGAFVGHVVGGVIALEYKGLVNINEINRYSMTWGFATAVVTFAIVIVAHLWERREVRD